MTDYLQRTVRLSSTPTRGYGIPGAFYKLLTLLTKTEKINTPNLIITGDTIYATCS
jgi:hypothetical protein